MQPVKNKKLTYLLICAVAIVWGIILYKVFFNESDADYQPGNQSVKVIHEPYDQYLPKNDTFRLALNYRDPFLGEVYVAPQPKTQAAVVQMNLNPPPPPPAPVDWSFIKYSGYMINPKTKKLVSIMVVNEKERMVAEGESLDGVKLLRNKKDSILVSWHGKQKYIKQ